MQENLYFLWNNDMNFTLHLTEQCNMDCIYCIHEKKNISMAMGTLKAACDLAFSIGTRAGLCFFGGEPMLEREKIEWALDYCEEKSRITGMPFSSKMTTNGTLLDEEFILRAKRSGMVIGLSFDGTAQKISRKYKGGGDSFEDIERISKMLLREMPDSYAMLTLAPEAVSMFYESVKYLYGLGFRKMTATIAYGKRAVWTDEQIGILRNEFLRIADFFEECFLSAQPFFFSPFDSKIRECIAGFNPAERCHLGFRQMPVAPNGRIYACTQFIGDEEYSLGAVFSGIDTQKQINLAKHSSVPKECLECELKSRCTNSCGCVNRLETGNESKISPLQCTYERMVIEISDGIAERLFEKSREKFIMRFGKI